MPGFSSETCMNFLESHLSWCAGVGCVIGTGGRAWVEEAASVSAASAAALREKRAREFIEWKAFVKTIGILGPGLEIRVF